jgi:hypothetical protein
MKKLLAVMAILALMGCSSSNSGGGGGSPEPEKKEICQACTTDSDCKSGDCRKFVSGLWRCVPTGASAGYRCPSGMYKEACE